MNLIKVGNTVVNLDQLVSITRHGVGLITVETAQQKTNYSSDSDYALLYKFLTADSVEFDVNRKGGIQIVTVKKTEDNVDSENTVEQLIETGVHENKPSVIEFAQGKFVRFA